MVESHPKSPNTPTGKSSTLVCPSCSKAWHKCQCSTRKVDLTESVIEAASGASQKGSSDLIGTTVDSRYEIVEILGSGGMGEVYLAKHVSLNKRFALKILRKSLLDSEVVVERLRREAIACAKLTHPNLVDVLDFGITDNGFPFIAMKFIEGKSLDQFESMEPDQIIRIVKDVACGLGHAHEKGVVHRDLKPANILISNPGSVLESAIVVDFGIAKTELPGGEMQNLTQTGEVIGSPAYMSPEQIQGKPVDGRSDIYSLGCILFELLADQQLFRGHTMLAVIETNLQTEPPTIEYDGPEKEKLLKLDTIMRKCLQKDPDRRYQNIVDISRELETITPEGTNGKPLQRIYLILSSLIAGGLIASGIALMSLPSHTTDNTSQSKANPYQELFQGRLLNLSEYDEQAKEKYKSIFKNTKNTELKIAAMAEYLNERKSGLDSSHTNIQLRTIREMRKRAEEAELLIEKSIAIDSKIDFKTASLIYFLHSSALKSLADNKVKEFCPDQSKFATYSNVAQYASSKNHEIRKLYKDSYKLLKKAIQLAEKEQDSSLQLALYYGYCAERLRLLGNQKGSIEASLTAINLLKDSKKTAILYHSVWWHCDLGRTYLAFNELDKAKEEHSAARKLVQKYPGHGASSYLEEYTREINQYLEFKKNEKI